MGEEARVLAGLPTKLTLFDDFAATLPLVSESGEVSGAIVVHRSPLLDALAALFDAYWARAVPLTPDWPRQDRPRAGGQEAGSRAARLVTLLSAGMTDEAIRRALGVNSSTVQRSVSELLHSLGARTRFQAGLQIGRGQARGDQASQD
jgi:DNA-binding NarL/FixJ family response regulator